MNIRFVLPEEKTIGGLWPLGFENNIVIVFYRLNYPNKHTGCTKKPANY